MDQSPNLSFPYIAAAQSQKHVTHNEAIRMLDALVQLSVLDRTRSAPQPSPADGDRHIVGSAPTGIWAGRQNTIAAFQDGGWAYFAPREGWLAWIAAEDVLVAWTGSAWTPVGGGTVNPTPLVGVNATADTSNRLSVAGPATLLSHDGSDHRLKVNKAAAANTASLLLQRAFSGRAEIGLTGDDNLHVKVSADGTAWTEALVIDRTTGVVTLPATPPSGGSGGVNPSILVNGDFQINQRAFAGGALAASAYGFDRWRGGPAGANLSIAGSTVTLASGAIEQPIEPAVWGVASLASSQVTVSVDAPSADLTVTLGSASGTITAGSGRRSVTLTTSAGDTGNLALRIARATSGSVTFARVKAELAAAATLWQPRPLMNEIWLARRYCQTVMRGNATSGSSVAPFYFQLVSGVVVDGLFTPPIELRAAPAMLTVGGNPTYQGSNPATGNTWAFYNNSTGGFAAATGAVTPSFIGAGSNGFGVRLQAAAFSTASGGVGNLYIGPSVRILADAEI